MLEAWLTHQAGVFSLEMLRISGLLVAAPMAWSFMPMNARAGLVMLLALVVHQPTETLDVHGWGPASYLVMATSELFVGFSIGVIARLILMVGEVAADAVAPMMGLGAAQMFDPTLGGQGTVLTRVLRYAGIWVFLAVGVHHLLIGALIQSFALLPIGGLANPASLTEQMMHLSSVVLTAGVKLALPFLAVLFIAQVGLAFIARAAPAMQIFSVGFAVTLGIGFSLWVVFAPDVVLELAQLRSLAEQSLNLQLLTLRGGE